jgi:hypothetical protein
VPPIHPAVNCSTIAIDRTLHTSNVPAKPAKPGIRPSVAWLWGQRYAIVYFALALGFVMVVARFYQPDTGFTSLERFGDWFQAGRLQRLHDVPIYTLETSQGYDGQFYAQLAVAGNPLDPELRRALDSAPYRSRRILIPALSHLVGLGRPAWVLNVYALSNLFCWLVLAWLLARWWFPPTGLHNLLRWVGTLFCAGMVVSVTRSLSDGPALLLLAVGVRCLEVGRRRLGVGVLAVAGLARETSILGVVALAPAAGRDRGAWIRAALAALVAVLPILLWVGFLTQHHGRAGGSRNFDLPLASYFNKLRRLHAYWHSRGWRFVADEVWVVIALPVQVAFIVCRRQPKLAWWRIGAMYSLLWIFLGAAVWEGTPSAATRAVLPLALAFNILVPRTRLGLVLLVAGNLTVLSTQSLAVDVPAQQTVLRENIRIGYGPGWFGQEQQGPHTWRWARGSTTLQLHNPNPRAFLVTLEFDLHSVLDRSVELRTADLQRSVALSATEGAPVRFGPFLVPPGDATVRLTTSQPPWTEPGAEGRGLTFALYDLNGTITPQAPVR